MTCLIVEPLDSEKGMPRNANTVENFVEFMDALLVKANGCELDINFPVARGGRARPLDVLDAFQFLHEGLRIQVYFERDTLFIHVYVNLEF
jgi:hypothetical protein